MSGFHPFFRSKIYLFFLIVTVWKNSVFQPGYKNTHFFPDSQRVGGRGGRSFSFLLQWPKMRKGMRCTGKHRARSTAMLPTPGQGQWPDPQPISVLSSHFLLEHHLTAGIQPQVWLHLHFPCAKGSSILSSDLVSLRQHLKIALLCLKTIS